jgi:DNA-binding MarR family transcriptional regulator
MAHTRRIVEEVEQAAEPGHGGLLEDAATVLLSVLPRMIRVIKHSARYGEQSEQAGPLRELGDSQVMVLFTLRHQGTQLTRMTRIVDELVKKGLVERQPDTKDRRCIFLELTEAGREVAAVAQEHGRKALVEYLQPLSNEELADISRAFGHLRRLLPEALRDPASCPVPRIEQAHVEGGRGLN